jgi:hypothetical protein
MIKTGIEFGGSSPHAAKQHCSILGRIKLKQERLDGDTYRGKSQPEYFRLGEVF